MEDAFGGVALLLGMTAALAGLGWRINARRRTRTTRIGDVPAATAVKVVGRVRFRGPPLEAPLTGRRCAHYRVRAVYARRADFDEAESLDFFVEDTTGRALVPMKLATVRVMAFVERDSSMPDADRMDALLARRGVSPSVTIDGATFTERVRYFESVLEEDDIVAVLGSGHWEADGAKPATGSYRDAAPRLLVFDGAVTVTTAPSVTGMP